MKIGILGCGYVGKSAALYFKNRGHYICTTTRKRERLEELAAISDDVTLLTSFSLPFFLKKIDCLFLTVAPDSSIDYRSTYLDLTREISLHTPSCLNLQKIIYTSSTSVYGNQKGKWTTETSPLKPVNENGQILCNTEKILLSLKTKSLSICIFRLSEIYGPNRDVRERLKKQSDLVFPGDGSSIVNRIHLNDIIEALYFALKKDLRGIYNLCNDFHPTRKEFYDQICESEKIPCVKWDPSLASLHGGNRKISNEKIKKAGFMFSEPF